MYIQTGSVSNNGIELALGYENTFGKLKWASNYTFSANKNKINELVKNYVHPETGAIINKDRLDLNGMGSAHFLLKEGGSLGDLYSLTDVVRDSEGRVYVDENGKVYKNNNVGDIKLGSVFPKCNMAWRNDFSYKGINFGFMFAARFGGIVYSATQAALDAYGVSKATADARDLGYVLVNGEDRVNPEHGIALSVLPTVFPSTIPIALPTYVCRRQALVTPSRRTYSSVSRPEPLARWPQPADALLQGTFRS